MLRPQGADLFLLQPFWFLVRYEVARSVHGCCMPYTQALWAGWRQLVSHFFFEPFALWRHNR